MRETVALLAAAVSLFTIGLLAWQLQSLHAELTDVRHEVSTVHHEVSTLQTAVRRLSRGPALPPAATPVSRRTADSRSAGPTSVRVVVRVTGLDFEFAPATVSVSVGAAVKWVNDTEEPHTVTSFQQGLFYRDLNPHATVTLVFHRPGTYRYYCGYHPYMRGTIVVRP